MRVLFVHNNYGKYSGEEAVVDKMAEMFKNHGHYVFFYRKTTEGVRESLSGKIKGFLSGIYSLSGVRGMREALNKYKPDVVNVHNLFPFISPVALFECKKSGVPVIMTVHNFRLICPTGLFMRNGLPCEKCLVKGSEWSCIKYNCEKSLQKSVGYTLRNVVARKIGVYKKCVDRFVCITEFQKRKLIQAGFDENKIVVIPNFLNSSDIIDSEYVEGEYVAYSGRLSSEKGVDLILEVARRHKEIKFKFAGELRDRDLIESGISNNCEFVGYLSGDALQDFYKKSRFVVMASKWYEGFPMTILETARYKKTTIGPEHGGFTEIIGKSEDAIGKLFKPNDVDDLEKQVVQLWNSSEEIKKLGNKAFDKLNRKYCSEAVYGEWEKLIQSVMCKV